MKIFGEQPIKPKNEKVESSKPPEIVDFGVKALFRAHNLPGAEILGPMALDSVASQSLNMNIPQNTIDTDVHHGAAITDVFKKEQAAFKQADELLRRIKNGEIGGKKDREVSEEK